MLQCYERFDPRNFWFDGIDMYHIYFEGLHPKGKGWEVKWGS